MLHKAEEKKLVRKAPKLKLLPEFERQQRLDEESERKLLAAGPNVVGGRRACSFFRTSSS